MNTTTNRGVRWLVYGVVALLAIATVDALVYGAYYDAWTWGWGWDGGDAAVVASSVLAAFPILGAIPLFATVPLFGAYPVVAAVPLVASIGAVAVVAVLLADRSRQRETAQ